MADSKVTVLVRSRRDQRIIRRRATSRDLSSDSTPSDDLAYPFQVVLHGASPEDVALFVDGLDVKVDGA